MAEHSRTPRVLKLGSYGTPDFRASLSAPAYHSSSRRKRSARLFQASSRGRPSSSKASCTCGTGKSDGMLGVPSSQSMARNCIAARTPPNAPPE